jgi:hypothetical protein
VPEEKRSECWWIVLRSGVPVAGDKGGGVLLLAELRLTRLLAQVLRVLRLSRAIDAFDTLVSRYRKRLGLFVPDGPALRRYP